MYDRKSIKSRARDCLRRIPHMWAVMLVWFALAVIVPASLQQLLFAGNVSQLAAELRPDIVADARELLAVLASAAKTLSVAAILSLIIGLYRSLLNFGLSNYCVSAWNYKRPGAGDFLAGFPIAGRVIGASILVGVFSFLWALLALIPTALAIVFFQTVLEQGAALLMMIALLCVFFAALVAISMRYAMVNVALASDPKLTAMGAIACSVERMRGNKGKYFVLLLSFAGWSVLFWLIGAAIQYFANSVIVDIPAWGSAALSQVAMLPAYLWLVPYVLTATAGFYEATGAAMHAPDVSSCENG